MPDTYAVSPDAVAAELPALFGVVGFSEPTKVTKATVTSWISAADVIATLHVQRAAAVVPASTDQAAPLARRYVIAFVKGQVMRALYSGRAPQEVESAAAGFERE